MGLPNQPESAGIEQSDEILTDHDYDGIMEYDNPTPGWWQLIWFGSIVFGLLYVMVYHLSPMILSPQEKLASMKRAAMERKYGEIAEIPLSDDKMLMLMNSDDWHTTGETIFTLRCASCHGDKGQGFQGPNMTDDSYKNIKTLTDFFGVIKNGAAGGTMPAQGNLLNDSQISVVAAYMASLRGKNLPGPRPAEGEVIPPWPTQGGAPSEPSTGDMP